MIEERDANPTADTPGRFRGRRAPTALTAGGTESSEVVARLSGTERSYGAGGEAMATSSLHVTDGVARCPSRTTPACAGAGFEPVPGRPWTKIARSLP
jgi:hypothetical protein